MYRILGEPEADKLVARSLSGMLLAPLHNTANPVVRQRRPRAQRGGAGLLGAGDRLGGHRHHRRRRERQPHLRQRQRLDRAGGGAHAAIGDAAAHGQQLHHDAAGADQPRSPRSTSTSSCRSRRGAHEAAEYRGHISNWLADHYSIYVYGVVDGEGIAITNNTTGAPGDRYTQVGVLYGIGATAPQLQGAVAQANAQTGARGVVDSGN